MSDSPFSTTSYLPWDAGAPPLFRWDYLDNTIGGAFLALLAYDHLITLDKEIEWIWTLKWRLPKMLFVTNRYVITSLLFLESMPSYIFPVSISFCRFYAVAASLIPIFSLGTAELLIIVRVCSLYNNRKLFVWSLRGLLFVGLIGALVIAVSVMRTYQTILAYKFLPGCARAGPDVNIGWIIWAIFLVLEGIYMLLTAYKVLSYRKTMNQTVTLLARDSIVYFVLIFASMMVNLIADRDPNFPFRVTVPTQCITSVAVGRMMMNIRGLILDDPEHTVHLQTLQFNVGTTAAPETDEVSW